MEKNIPVISFVGYSDSGKTTFINRLVERLKADGIECAYLKHTHHDNVIEEMIAADNKDTSKLIASGAKISAVMADGEVIWMQKIKPDIKKIVSMVEDVNLIIIEGYKKEDFPKVMVTTSDDPNEWPVDINDCLAVISDVISDASKPVFKRDEIDNFTEWLMKNIAR